MLDASFLPFDCPLGTEGEMEKSADLLLAIFCRFAVPPEAHLAGEFFTPQVPELERDGKSDLHCHMHAEAEVVKPQSGSIETEVSHFMS